MATTSILKLFNNHLIEFMDDVLQIFPNNLDLKTAKTFIEKLKKINPKSIIMTWYEYIAIPYKLEIEKGDFSFFENKDYSNDLKDSQSQEKILNTINQIRKEVKHTIDNNKKKTIKYLKNLSKMSILYNNK